MLFYNFDLEKQTKKRIQSFTKLVALQKKIDFFQKKKGMFKAKKEGDLRNI